MTTHYSIFLNESLQKQQKILPSYRSFNAEDIRGTISSEIFLLVVTDIDFWLQIKIFVYMLPFYMDIYILRAWYIPNMEKYTFFLPTLDGLASIFRPKQPINLIH